jgi:Transglycosylase SLT domain
MRLEIGSRSFAVVVFCLAGLGEANHMERATGPDWNLGQIVSDQINLDQIVQDKIIPGPIALDPTTLDQIITDRINPTHTPAIDAFGYLGGLFEARFYEPHATTGDPRDEIKEAGSLYGVDLAMMMSIAKVESDFNPRARTGSYKGLFQLSDYEFGKYGDGSIWDARDNARAAAHMFLVQAERFRWALGHYPDYAERYMVHQQGIQGAIEHYTHPDRVAWQSMCATDEGMKKGEEWCKRTIWGNLLPRWKEVFGSVEKISSSDFVSLWTGRINHFAYGTAWAASLAQRFSLIRFISPRAGALDCEIKNGAALWPRRSFAER